MKVNLNTLDLFDDLAGQLYDQWFDLDMLERDEEREEVRLFFGRSRKGPFNKYLTIKGVKNLAIDDKERVGTNTLEDIRIDLERKRLVITGHVPLKIVADIGPNFSIELSAADNREGSS